MECLLGSMSCRQIKTLHRFFGVNGPEGNSGDLRGEPVRFLVAFVF
jgi:hypothetical protein